MVKHTFHYLTSDPPVRYQHAEFSVPSGTGETSGDNWILAQLWHDALTRAFARMRADMTHRLYGDPDYSLDRWADDGGR